MPIFNQLFPIVTGPIGKRLQLSDTTSLNSSNCRPKESKEYSFVTGILSLGIPYGSLPHVRQIDTLRDLLRKVALSLPIPGTTNCSFGKRLGCIAVGQCHHVNIMGCPQGRW